jgi:hypothetical protein
LKVEFTKVFKKLLSPWAIVKKQLILSTPELRSLDFLNTLSALLKLNKNQKWTGTIGKPNLIKSGPN